MPCRVGITADVAARRNYRSRRVQGMRQFQVISSHKLRCTVQAAENKKATTRGCHSSSGGGGNPYARWHVYHFFYTRDM